MRVRISSRDQAGSLQLAQLQLTQFHNIFTPTYVAPPDILYDGNTTHRYIIFPTADSSREVNLSCPIRPGALSERYSVRWESQDPLVASVMDYDLLLTTTASSTFQYQCQVTIQHHTEGNNTLTYGGPVTVLEKLGMILKDDDDDLTFPTYTLSCTLYST